MIADVEKAMLCADFLQTYWKLCNFFVKESSREKRINFGAIVNLKNADTRVPENSSI